MNCPNCGYQNPEGTTMCAFCGKDMRAHSQTYLAPEPSGTYGVGGGEQGSRQCVSCGRSIPWTANVCPYCGHDYRIPAYGMRPQETISPGLRAVFYILSIFIPLAGIIIGIIYYAKPDPESKHVGRNCILIAVIVWAAAILLSLLTYVFIIGFGTASWV